MKKIMILTMLLIAIPLCLAEAEMNVSVITDGNLDANIIEIADGDINTNIHCYGASCTTNINGGTVNIPKNQSFEYNDYSEYSTTINEKKLKGLSLKKFIYSLNAIANNYINGVQPTHNNDNYNFWSLLDYMFVSHKEYEPVRLNTYYLAEEIDAIKAENKLLRNYLDITWNVTKLECQTAIITAKRTGMNVVTQNGWMVDLELFGEECIKLETNNNQTINQTVD